MRFTKPGLALLAVCAAAFLTGRATATGIPSGDDALVYSGTLSDAAGTAVSKPTQVRAGLFAGAKGGTARCETAPVLTAEKTGRFEIPLGAACVKAVHDDPLLYVEVIVGSTQQTVMPRTKLTAVPYAVEAEAAGVAASASGSLKAKLEALDAKIAAVEARLPRPLAFESSLTGTLPISVAKGVQTGGGKLLVIVAGNVKGPVNATYPAGVTLQIDGVSVLTAKGATYNTSGYPDRNVAASAIVDSIPAGGHNIGLIAAHEKQEAYESTFTVTIVEYPK